MAKFSSLYFACYATMPMLADDHISSLGYLWSLLILFLCASLRHSLMIWVTLSPLCGTFYTLANMIIRPQSLFLGRTRERQCWIPFSVDFKTLSFQLPQQLSKHFLFPPLFHFFFFYCFQMYHFRCFHCLQQLPPIAVPNLPSNTDLLALDTS